MNFYDKYLKGVKWLPLLGVEYAVVTGIPSLLLSSNLPKWQVWALTGALALLIALVYLFIPKGPETILEVIAKTGIANRVPSWAVVPVETPPAPAVQADTPTATIVQPPVAPLATPPAPTSPDATTPLPDVPTTGPQEGSVQNDVEP